MVKLSVAYVENSNLFESGSPVIPTELTFDLMDIEQAINRLNSEFPFELIDQKSNNNKKECVIYGIDCNEHFFQCKIIVV